MLNRFQKFLILYGKGIYVNLPFKMMIAIRFKWEWDDSFKIEVKDLVKHNEKST